MGVIEHHCPREKVELETPEEKCFGTEVNRRQKMPANAAHARLEVEVARPRTNQLGPKESFATLRSSETGKASGSLGMLTSVHEQRANLEWSSLQHVVNPRVRGLLTLFMSHQRHIAHQASALLTHIETRIYHQSVFLTRSTLRPNVAIALAVRIVLHFHPVRSLNDHEYKYGQILTTF